MAAASQWSRPKQRRLGVYAGSRWPYFLPDGKHFLFVRTDGDEPRGKLYAGSIDSEEVKPILPENTAAAYANGYLFFVKDDNLVAQPFDPARLALTGNPVAVASKVEYPEAKSQGNFSVSNNGVLVYRNAYSTPTRMIWLDRNGKHLGTVGEPGYYFGQRPPARWPHTIVLARTDASDASKNDLWLVDVQKGIFPASPSIPIRGIPPIWSPGWQPPGARFAGQQDANHSRQWRRHAGDRIQRTDHIHPGLVARWPHHPGATAEFQHRHGHLCARRFPIIPSP